MGNGFRENALCLTVIRKKSISLKSTDPLYWSSDLFHNALSKKLRTIRGPVLLKKGHYYHIIVLKRCAVAYTDADYVSSV